MHFYQNIVFLDNISFLFDNIKIGSSKSNLCFVKKAMLSKKEDISRKMAWYKSCSHDPDEF